ncbi:MAG: UDP-2,3-diacylglucosamine diphosphatase [Bacteroidaceae bacterium]|nr:UDP-2,3-diacylglucosamine diphosphatase [Bacteroidaceae bacterium]
MKPIYFIADAHLGSRAIAHGRTQERRLVRFLDSIKEKAGALYMLGDMFDFWYEYTTVVPRGYTRFLGKLSELTDLGVEVHYFTGNHDIWSYSYLEQECGVIMHREPLTIELADKVFFLAHGDGLGKEKASFRFIQSIFHNRFCQILFSAIHPRWGLDFGLKWAAKSRIKHERQGGEPPYQGEDKEELVLFAKNYLTSHPNVNYFLFGHRHIELELILSRSTRLIILGDWISKFTFAVFDGEQLWMENYIEGDTQP